MISLDVPTTISRDLVMAFIRSLGIDPDSAISLTIDPERVELVVPAKNAEGKWFHAPGGDKAATHTISLEMK